MASWQQCPEKINKEANTTWMVKVTLKNPDELKGLLSAADYEKFVNEERRPLAEVGRAHGMRLAV